jgi:hypothetical protein
LRLRGRPASETGVVLTATGLSYENVWRALEMEFEQSLAAVGVPAGMFMLDAMRIVPPARTPTWVHRRSSRSSAPMRRSSPMADGN